MMAIPIVMAAMAVMQGVAQMQAQKQNALNTKAEGEAAMNTANAEAGRQKRIDDAKLGQMRADIGAQGSEFEGSPMLAYLDSVKNAALGQEDLRYKGQLGQFEKGMEAKNYERAASSALWGGVMNGVSKLVGGYMGGGMGGGMGGSLGSSLLTSNNS
jgi:hypothetical protein